MAVNNQNIPDPGIAWLKPDGTPTLEFFQFLLNLYMRTGGAQVTSGAGGASGITLVTNQITEIVADTSQVFSLATLALLSSDETTGGPTTKTVVTATSSNVDIMAQLLAIMPEDFASTAPGSGGTVVVSGGLLPLVNGDLPGPSAIATSDGQFIGVPMT